MSLEDVESMTIDQVLFILTDRKMLMKRQRSFDSDMAHSLKRKDGKIPGRTASGELMFAEVKGTSKASRLAKEAEDRRAAGEISKAREARRVAGTKQRGPRRSRR